MSSVPKLVCLCGSTRWPELHHKAMMEETLAGRIVLALGVYGHADYPPGSKEITNDSDHSLPVKQMLDELHRRKIAISDEILVVSKGGYIGDVTKEDIDYAASLGKPVRYWHDCKFTGHSRRSPAGGNRRDVSVIVSECRCGKIQAKFPDKLSYWDRRWIERVNRRAEKHPQPTTHAH